MAMRLQGSTAVTRQQVMDFCNENKMPKYVARILDLCIEKGSEYNIRYDIGFSLCLLYTSMFHLEVVGYNVAGLGLQMGCHFYEIFDSYEECIDTLFILIRSLSDETFVKEDCTREIYLKVFEPNEEMGYPSGFAGKFQTLEELVTIWNSNLEPVQTSSIEQFVYLMIQSFTMQKIDTIDFTNDRNVSFFVRLESKNDLKAACQLKRKIEALPFIKNKVPVQVISSVDANIKSKIGFYVVEVGDFKYRGLAQGCEHNLKMYGYYGKVLNRPSQKFYAKLEEIQRNKEEN